MTAAKLAPVETEPHRAVEVMTAALVAVVVLGAGLRLWDLGSTPLSIDETYTALAARLPLSDVVGHIDATDPHGPLSYLLLQPVAALTTDVGALRMVSVLCSIAALVVMAVWQRHEGVSGLVATAIFAVAPFQLLFGRQVRMYGLLALLGVVAAWSAQRWLVTPCRRWTVAIALAGLAASLTHATGPILLGGVFLLPGLRRDRAAWELRGAVVVSTALFAVLWGGHTLRWGGRSWFPAVTPDWASIVVNETIAPVPGNRWLVLALSAAGAAVVLVARGPRARVWVCLFVAPLVALYLASLEQGLLIPKSLVLFGWALPVALGALCGWLRARSILLGAAAVIGIGLLVVPYSVESLHQDEGARTAFAEVLELVPEGEPIATPAGTWQVESLVGWYGDLQGKRPTLRTERVGDLDVFFPTESAGPGRVWFVAFDDAVEPAGHRPCGPVEAVGGMTVRCLEHQP